MANESRQLPFGKGITLQRARTWDEGLESNFKVTPIEELFGKGQKVVVFGLPGAFTGVCSKAHVPSYKRHTDDFKKLGVDKVICIAVNDPYCMYGWAKALDVDTKDIEFYGDFEGKFHDAIDLNIDLSEGLLGKRARRYGMYVEDGEIKILNVEKVPSDFTVSSGDHIYDQLTKMKGN